MSKIKIVLTLSIFILISATCSALSPIAPTAVETITPTQTQAIPTAAPTQTQPTAFIPQTADQVARISLNEAKSAFDNHSAIFVDTRSQQAYQASHIKGALASGDFEASPLSLDKHQWIITYCTWQNEHTSARVALELIQKGYTNVAPLLGGLQAWIEAEYPIEP